MVEMVDGTQVFHWLFGLTSATPSFPGPVIFATSGDDITINITNNLNEPHAFQIIGTRILTHPSIRDRPGQCISRPRPQAPISTPIHLTTRSTGYDGRRGANPPDPGYQRGLYYSAAHLRYRLAGDPHGRPGPPHIATGGNHTVILKSDGSLWGWGENTFGQVGDGSVVSRKVPVKISTNFTWTTISAGFYHTVALKSGGSLWAWGDDTKGQLGDGLTAFSQPVPVRIGTHTDWLDVVAGSLQTVALKSNNSVQYSGTSITRSSFTRWRHWFHPPASH